MHSAYTFPFLSPETLTVFWGKIISKSHQSQFRSIKNPQDSKPFNYNIYIYMWLYRYILVYIYIILYLKTTMVFPKFSAASPGLPFFQAALLGGRPHPPRRHSTLRCGHRSVRPPCRSGRPVPSRKSGENLGGKIQQKLGSN